MSLVNIKEFNVLIHNKQFFDQPVKRKQKRMKNFFECHEIMTIQQKCIRFFILSKL